MKVSKLIFVISLLVIFVVATLVAMFSTGRVVNAALSAYVFEVEDEWCDERKAIPAEETPLTEIGEEAEGCGIDYNGAKRDIAGGISYMVVSLPVAYFAFRKSRQLFRKEE